MATNGTIVAICDNRHTKHGDIGQAGISDLIDIVYKFSKDGGNTWSEERIIPPKSSDTSLSKTLNKGDAIVFRHIDGTLVCMAVSGGGYIGANNKNTTTPSRMLRSESTDNGETWSDWEEVGINLIQSEIKSLHGKPQGALSSGRGLTLKDGTFAAAMSGPDWSIIYVYSKDKGRTWNYGRYIKGSESAEQNKWKVLVAEPKVIAELEDGKLLMSIRNSATPNQGSPRAYMVSTTPASSGDANWPQNLSFWDFKDGGVDAEGVVWTTTNQDKNRMLHIQAGPIGRKGLKLYLSEDEGRNNNSWREIRTILSGNQKACYSSIDILGDGTVVTLVEEETEAKGTAAEQYDIVFRRYNMKTLINEVYKTEWYKGEIIN